MERRIRNEKKEFGGNDEPFCRGRNDQKGSAMERQIYSLGIRIP